MTSFIRSLFFLFFLLFGMAASVKAADNSENRVDLIGKVVDKYYLDFAPAGKIELPRIIYDNKSWYFYGSTSSLLASESGFIDGAWLETGRPAPGESIKPVTYQVLRADGTAPTFDLSITSHLVWFWFAALLVALIFLPLSMRYRKGIGRYTEPKGAFQNMFETLVLFIRDDIARPNIGEKKYMTFTPYLLTVFFLILFMNFFGLMPWGVSPTADITVTAVLAVFTFLATQLFASKEHWKHVFWFPGVPVPIKFILLPVELIGLFTKPFALCIRLFANMASGKILIFSLLGTIFIFSDLFGPGVAYGTSWIWIFLTLFVYLIKALVSFIQAYVFTILSALFIGLAVDDHSEEHAHH